jgi:hypothetical protein
MSAGKCVFTLLALAAFSGYPAHSASAKTDSQGPVYAPKWERDLEPALDTALHVGADTTAEKPGSPGQGRAPLGRFLLDAPLFAHTREDFADLRLTAGLADGEGKPLGIQVRPVTGHETHCGEEPAPMRRVSLQVLGDSAFEAVFTAEDPKRLPDRISVAVEDRDFEISLSLWTAPSVPVGSPAGDPNGDPAKAAWTPRLTAVPLFDYSRFVDLRREEARWAPTEDRAVRLRVSGLTQMQRSLVSTLSGQVGRPGAESYQVERKLLRIEAVSFQGEVCSTHKGGILIDSVALATGDAAHPIAEPDAKRSWYVFPAGRIPIRALQFRIGTRNFMRSAVLHGLPDSLIAPRDPAAKPWTWPRFAEGRLHRIDWGGRPDANLRLPLFPTGRFATLALGITDNDDAPLALQGILAETERMEAVFPAESRDRYLLRYGDPGAKPLRFDFENLLDRSPGSSMAAYALSAPRGLAAAAPREASGAPWLTGEMLLTAGLALAIGVLMVLVFLVARKAGKAG